MKIWRRGGKGGGIREGKERKEGEEREGNLKGERRRVRDK